MFGKKWSMEMREKIMKKRESINHHKSKSIIIIDNNKTLNFKNIKKASEFLKVNYNSLRCLLNKSENVFIDEYQVIKSN